MDPMIRTILDAQGGVTNAHQLAAAGVSRHVVLRHVRRRELIRLARGIIVDATAWRKSQPWDRHALRARGLMHGPVGAGESPVALSHHSALAVLEIPLFGVDAKVHIVRDDGRRSSSDAIVAAHAPVESAWIGESGGLRVVRPALATLQVAAAFGVEAGLVSADACLRDKRYTEDGLRAALAAGGYGNGTSRAREVVAHADGRAESPGESRLRWILTVLGLTGAVPQAAIKDASGMFIARVDLLFEQERTVVEFDGMGKYGKSGDLRSEKLREDAIRSCRYAVVRITWDDLNSPNRVRFKVLRGFEQARRFV